MKEEGPPKKTTSHTTHIQCCRRRVAPCNCLRCNFVSEAGFGMGKDVCAESFEYDESDDEEDGDEEEDEEDEVEAFSSAIDWSNC